MMTISILLLFNFFACKVEEPTKRPSKVPVEAVNIVLNANNILNDISSRPFGINLNTLTDDQMNRPLGSKPLKEAINDIGAKYLRYPGGEKSDVYMWSSSPFTSPTTSSLSRKSNQDFPASDARFWNLSLNTWANNNYNFDEFMTDCIAVGGEPVIVVALDGIYKPAFTGGTSLTREVALEMAKKWVEYANIKKGYKIKYWSIGNETWNKDSYAGANPGFTQYGIDVALFAKAMKEVDASIKIGINGENFKDFSEALAKCSPWVDFLDIHAYPCYGFLNYNDYEKKDLVFKGIINAAKSAINTLPTMDRNRIFIAMTEISAFGYKKGEWDSGANLGQSLANFELLASLANDSRVKFTQFWNSRWIDNDSSTPQATDVFTANNKLNANGKVLSLLHKNVFDKMVSISSNAKIKSFASLNSKTGELVVFLLNKSQSVVSVNLSLKNYKPKATVLQSLFGGTNSQDKEPILSELSNLQVNSNNKLELTTKPVSITILRLKSN